MKFHGYEVPRPKKNEIKNETCEGRSCADCHFFGFHVGNTNTCLPPILYCKENHLLFEAMQWVSNGHLLEPYAKFKLDLFKEYYNYKEYVQEELDV